VWEAVHILDGLMKNRSEIQPDTIHADTQGQSEPVFGLCRMLGIKLMPRMRGLGDVTFYRPAKGTRCQRRLHSGWPENSSGWAGSRRGSGHG